MEEICKRINEAEAQATNKKLDEVLANQESILRKLNTLAVDMKRTKNRIPQNSKKPF